MLVSIFNDVIGPVMRGNSSSHCAAALRIGRIGLDLMGGDLNEVLLEFDRNGSLPTTHDTQGSDMGLFGGLMGWEAPDENLPNSMQIIQERGVSIEFKTIDANDPHPNTYHLTLKNGQAQHNLRAISTGGGMIEVIQIDGFKVSIFGDRHETLLYAIGDGEAVRELIQEKFNPDSVLIHHLENKSLIEVQSSKFLPESFLDELVNLGRITDFKQISPVLPVLSTSKTSVPFSTCEEMLAYDGNRNTPLWKLAVEYECARGGLSEDEVVNKMIEIVRILRKSVAIGISGTYYEDRVLGHQSGEFQRLLQEGKLLNGGTLNRIVLYVTALMEVKSSMGVIVAMPTAGACAALPGAIIGMAEEMGLGELEMARAILASGLIGVFIATAWSFAAEVGGCQAEGGSASCMASAGLITLAGGSLKQAVGAASMGLQSMIGLICDPIAARVEAPCLGKNVMAASNALCCANMALAGYDQVIPLDEVIETAKRVSKQMPRELRCTALGGLSITPTSLAIEKKLALKRAACGSCGTCS